MMWVPFRVALALALVMALPEASWAQFAGVGTRVRTRSEPVARTASTSEAKSGRLLFAGIGIDKYERVDLWPELDNAKNDVEAVQKALERFHFESRPDWVLKDREATTDGIWELVDTLAQDVKPDDSLVFFFAGHGTERKILVGGDEVGREGYLVPQNVKGKVTEVERQYVRIEALLERLANLDVRHVFVILDSCRSGLSLTGIVKQWPSRGEVGGPHDLMLRHSRHVMSSATSDQDAADAGQVSPKNSRFTGWLVTALERAARGEAPAPGGEDGLVTATELFTFVRERVQEESRNRQTPRFGRFALDREGELVLALERDPFEPLLQQAVDAFDRDDPKAFRAAVETALAVRASGIGAEFLRYLMARQAGEPGPIRASLRELQRLVNEGEPIPSETRLSRGDLRVWLQQYDKICQKLSCAATK